MFHIDTNGTDIGSTRDLFAGRELGEGNRSFVIARRATVGKEGTNLIDFRNGLVRFNFTQSQRCILTTVTHIHRQGGVVTYVGQREDGLNGIDRGTDLDRSIRLGRAPELIGERKHHIIASGFLIGIIGYLGKAVALESISFVGHIPHKLCCRIGWRVVAMLIGVITMTFEDNTVTHAKMGTDKVVGVDAGNSQRIAIGIDVPCGVVNRHVTDVGRIVYHAIPCTEKCSLNHRFNLLARGTTVAAQGETGTALRTIDRNKPDGKRTTGVGGRDKYFLSLIVTRAIVDFRTDRTARARTVIDI